jgi:hypothetical protein
MANHGGIIHNKTLSSDGLKIMLDEINAHRFENKLEISRNEDDSFLINVFKGFGPLIWIESDTKIETRHGGGSDLQWWVDFVFTNELAFKVNGYIIDDGDDEESDGVENKYPTFLSYIHAHCKHIKNITAKNTYLRMMYKDAHGIRPDLVRIGIR